MNKINKSKYAQSKFLFLSRPVFRTVEILCNHTARVFENKNKLNCSDITFKLQKLNDKRIQGQRVLKRIGNYHGHVCADCKGKCCGGMRERDAFIDRILVDPQTSHRRARRKIGEQCELTDEQINAFVEAEPTEGHCSQLTNMGCRIPHSQRPIQCAAYFCDGAAEALTDEQLEIGSKALKSLMGVQLKTVGLAMKSRFSK